MSADWENAEVVICNFNGEVLEGSTEIDLKFDMIIVEWHSIKSITFLLRNYRNRKKIWFWGIGISSQNGLRIRIIDVCIKRFMVRIAAGAFVYSDVALVAFRKRDGISKVRVLRNTKQFYSKNNIAKESAPYIVGFIGSLNKRKGFEEFVEIISTLRKHIPVSCEIIGDGPMKEEFSIALASNSIQANFYGSISSVEEIADIVREWKVMLSPNQLGLSVVDVIVNGVPIVAKREHITGGESSYLIDGFSSFYYDSIEHGVEQVLNAVNMDANERDILAKVYKRLFDNQNFYQTIESAYENSCNS